MAKAQVAVYIQQAYDRQTYSDESFGVRQFAGVHVVADALRQAGIEVDFCDISRVSEYRVILVPIVSCCDWFSFIAERVRWQGFNGVIVVGGAGVMNIRPFRPYFDYAVLGRGEVVAVEVVGTILAGGRPAGPSVIDSERFDPDEPKVMAQAVEVYPREIEMQWCSRQGLRLATWKESQIGCPYGCAFCGYTNHRKYTGGEFNVAGEDGKDGGFAHSNMGEMTLMQTRNTTPEEWFQKGNLLIGLDGFSERLRFMANKPISDALLRRFLAGAVSLPNSYKLRMFNVVGLPTETREDWFEFLAAIKDVDAAADPGPLWYIDLHSTPFRPLPGTPGAGWQAAYEEFRGEIKGTLGPDVPHRYRFFQGRRIVVVETFSTESLARGIIEAVCHRGTEAHQEVARSIALDRRFASAGAPLKRKMLEAAIDTRALFQEFSYEEMPTRYLRGWRPERVVKSIADRPHLVKYSQAGWSSPGGGRTLSLPPPAAHPAATAASPKTS